MCICWCVTEINYKMHVATIKIVKLRLSYILLLAERRIYNKGIV